MVNHVVMRVTLQTCAQALGAGPTTRIVVVQDRAGDHSSPQVEVPDGLQLIFLPASSPELQPVEPRWPCSRRAPGQPAFPHPRRARRDAGRAL
jgi:hypothetical protein